eukprot:1160717-Pelagomonas_calceolata.AAC.12
MGTGARPACSVCNLGTGTGTRSAWFVCCLRMGKRVGPAYSVCCHGTGTGTGKGACMYCLLSQNIDRNEDVNGDERHARDVFSSSKTCLF